MTMYNCSLYPRLKNVACSIFYNWKKLKLEPIFVILAHSMLKFLASKCTHVFPPHLSCDLTLPSNTL